MILRFAAWTLVYDLNTSIRLNGIRDFVIICGPAYDMI